MRRMQRNAFSGDFYHVEVWTYPERVFIYILLVTPNWSCRLPCYIGKWHVRHVRHLEGHDPEHAIYFNHDFSLVEVILYVLATIWFDEASEIGYSFRQKKKKENEEERTKHKIEPNLT